MWIFKDKDLQYIYITRTYCKNRCTLVCNVSGQLDMHTVPNTSCQLNLQIALQFMMIHVLSPLTTFKVHMSELPKWRWLHQEYYSLRKVSVPSSPWLHASTNKHSTLLSLICHIRDNSDHNIHKLIHFQRFVGVFFWAKLVFFLTSFWEAPR